MYVVCSVCGRVCDEWARPLRLNVDTDQLEYGPYMCLECDDMEAYDGESEETRFYEINWPTR